MTNQQLELSFDSSQAFQVVIRSQRRLSRARWWFAQMRAVVDQAMEWDAPPPVHPEQADLLLAASRS